MKLRINTNGPVSVQFLNQGIDDWALACDYVKSIPYGRNSSRSNPLLVFDENRGTCSSKHGLLKLLAEENEWSQIDLVMVLYLMTARNTPKVSDVLSTFQLEGIPEAHICIKQGRSLLDCTTPTSSIESISNDVISERVVSVLDLEAHKPKWHRQYIEAWIEGGSVSYSMDELWSKREKCIQALAK